MDGRVMGDARIGSGGHKYFHIDVGVGAESLHGRLRQSHGLEGRRPNVTSIYTIVYYHSIILSASSAMLAGYRLVRTDH